LKVLHRDIAKSPDLLARFTREGHLGNLVVHPGAVVTLDDGVAEDGSPFLVMELLEGETLHERIARTRGPLAQVDAVRVIDVVLDVLAVAHARGLVHRDVKPSNVFLTRAGGVKLLDFGIAREGGPRRLDQTVAGMVLGTPAFMPRAGHRRLSRGRSPERSVVGRGHALLPRSSRYLRDRVDRGRTRRRHAAGTPPLARSPDIPPRWPRCSIVPWRSILGGGIRAREMQSALRQAIASPAAVPRPIACARSRRLSQARSHAPGVLAQDGPAKVAFASVAAAALAMLGVPSCTRGCGRGPQPTASFLPALPASFAEPALGTPPPTSPASDPIAHLPDADAPRRAARCAPASTAAGARRRDDRDAGVRRVAGTLAFAVRSDEPPL
jgi:hypothetical protein